VGNKHAFTVLESYRYATGQFIAARDIVQNPSAVCTDYRDRCRQPADRRRLIYRAPAGYCRGLRFGVVSQNARILNGCDLVRRSQASLHQVPLAYVMIDKIYTARRSVEMSSGRLG
jgi:hypothetical protein